LGAVFARQISFDAGALETVMFRHGLLSEAAASNVWVVKDGKVMGTPKDHLVLEGIRYGLIEEICRAAGIGFELRRVSREEVVNADELLLSSATKEVLAVTSLDGRPVGKGQPGPARFTRCCMRVTKRPKNRRDWSRRCRHSWATHLEPAWVTTSNACIHTIRSRQPATRIACCHRSGFCSQTPANYVLRSLHCDPARGHTRPC
jgi:hypothetical protein